MKKFFLGFSMLVLLAAFITGCTPTGGEVQDTTAPTVLSTIPADTATGVAASGNISATFDEEMDPATITATTFTLSDAADTPVSGVVSLSVDGLTATFNPDSALALDTAYNATITTGAMDLAGNALTANSVWSFTTAAILALGPAPVDLGSAGDFVILSKSGISTVPTSDVTGNIGVSPIDSTAITAFSLTMDASGLFSKSDQVTGNVYASDYTAPTPSNMTTAISNMETAYTDAAGRTLPDSTDLGAGDISGLTIAPGLYKWGTGVSINTDVTLSGGANDVWIFQISENLVMAGAKSVILSGGALPKNIFWQVAGGDGVTLGAGANFNGIVLAAKAVSLNTGATVNGRLYAQTAVTLDGNIVTQPAL
ncbi:MAG: ice-binding family protein [Rectinemataceae bacterium]